VTDEENIIMTATGLCPQFAATIPRNVCIYMGVYTGEKLCGFIINAYLL